MKRMLKSALKLALPYVLILLLPLAAVLCLGNTVITSYNNQLAENRQRLVETAFEKVVVRIQKIEDLSYLIVQNPKVLQFYYNASSDSEPSATTTLELIELFKAFMLNADASAMYYYIDRNGMIVTPDGAVYDATKFFSYIYCIEDQTPEQSLSEICTASFTDRFGAEQKIYIKGKLTEVIEYRLPVPINKHGSPASCITFALDTKQIFGELFDVLEEGASFSIYDYRDALIYSNDEKAEAFGEKIFEQAKENSQWFTLSTSDKQWKVKIYMPNNDPKGLKELNQVWLLMGIPILFSILLSIYFTIKNHKELLFVTRLLKKGVGYSEESYDTDVSYRTLRDYAENIVSESNIMKGKIQILECSQKYEIWDKLLRDTYKKEEIEEYFRYEKSNFADAHWVVLCICFENCSYRASFGEDETVKERIAGIIGAVVDRSFEIIESSDKELVCVLRVDRETVNMRVFEIVSRLNVEIAFPHQMSLEIGTGDIVDSAYQIASSYKQAKNVIKFRESTGNSVWLYSELEKQQDIYYYPKEYDEKIHSYIALGKADEAKALVAKIMQCNYGDRGVILSRGARELIRERMSMLLTSLSDKYGVKIDAEIARCKEGVPEQCFEAVYAAIDSIAKGVVIRKEGIRQRTANKIMQFVKDNYADSDLCLNEISRELGLNKNYVSNLFSQEYGETISSFIERLRMEKACEFIRNSEMKIEDIAQAVGYSSANSFRRVFKRVFGVLPTEYR